MNEAQRITEWVEQKKESAIALARAVWGFAEPNWRETQSAAAISAALEAEGFALERRPCGMETAFVATWGGEGPVIAFLANTTRCPRFPSRRAAEKRRFARARQAMAAGTTCWARAALPQPWR
ncbi:MAG: hypothetical protein ACLRRT_05675 [Ruthenibacterium lactatiformans]